MTDQLYIVTCAHNQDYISATAFLTQASSPNEAIIKCMEYEDDIPGYDYDKDDGGDEYQAELSRLRSLPLHTLEGVNRDEYGDVWHAEVFEMPTFDENTLAVQIAKLDTD